jgi:hypothetical protein
VAPVGFVTRRLRRADAVRGRGEAGQRRVEGGQFGRPQRLKHQVVEAHRLREQLFMELASAPVERHAGTALVGFQPDPVNQLLGDQVAHMARDACAFEVRPLGQLRGRQRALRRQDADQAPLAAGDAVAAFAQPRDHAAAALQQAAQAVIQQVFDGDGAGEAHGAMRTAR